MPVTYSKERNSVDVQIQKWLVFPQILVARKFQKNGLKDVIITFQSVRLKLSGDQYLRNYEPILNLNINEISSLGGRDRD